MTSPARGRADYWLSGDWNALCYQCGRKRKSSTLIRHWQGYWLCPEHWEPRQPQDFVRGITEQPAPPWVQPPGLDGIPQLFLYYDTTNAGTEVVTVSTETVAAVNDTLLIITIYEGVYIGTLDLSGVPDGWSVQINNYGKIGGITNIPHKTVTRGPGKPIPETSELFDLTAVQIDSTTFGQLYQPPVNIWGNIDANIFGGYRIESLYSDTFLTTTYFSLYGLVSANLFYSITIGSTTLLVSAATFSYPVGAPGTSRWTWTSAPIPVAGDYDVTIVTHT